MCSIRRTPDIVAAVLGAASALISLLAVQGASVSVRESAAHRTRGRSWVPWYYVPR